LLAASNVASVALRQRSREGKNEAFLRDSSRALLLTVTPVLAEESKIEMKKLSCKQFSGYDKDIIMMWLEGYCTDENEGAVIYFSKMAGDTAHLLVYCGDHPDDDLITAVEEVLGN
jgi:HdeA/HdeB family